MVEGSDANCCGQQGVSTKAVELHQLTMYHGEALATSEELGIVAEELAVTSSIAVRKS